MAGKIAPAAVATAASEIDFTDRPLAEPLTRTFDNRTDKFVTGHPGKTHVAFENLQISGANTGEMNFDQRDRFCVRGRATAGRP
jgi:hypothetical protein